MNEIEKLFDFFGFTDQDLIDKLYAISEIRQFLRGEEIYSTVDSNGMILINIDGIQRVFVSDDSGMSFTNCFSHKYGQCLLADPIIRIDENTPFVVEAITNSTLLMVPMAEFNKLRDQFPVLEELYTTLFNADYLLQGMHKLVLATYTAEQKYRWFLENYPGLIDKLPHKYIASYLNMSSVTLSRTRALVKKKDSEAKQDDQPQSTE